MTALSPLRPILNDTPASAIDVDWNFQTLEDYTATDVVKRDGSVAMEAPLNLLGPAPSLATHAVTKGYVDTNIIPIGTIWQFAGDTAPPAWAFCDYSEKSSTDPAWVPLFQVIGYKYGQNGTNFFLPDMRGRVPVGRSVGDALFGALGAKGGSRDLILPAHVHNIGNHYHGMKNHYHGLNGHTHYMNHQHDMANHNHLESAHAGYTVNSANQSGSTNAIFPATGNTPLVFDSRPTAVMTSQHAGPDTDWTKAINNNTTGWGRDWTDGNSGASGGPSDNNTDWGGATDTDSRGVSPTNANVPPYTTINFIIRVG